MSGGLVGGLWVMMLELWFMLMDRKMKRLEEVGERRWEEEWVLISEERGPALQQLAVSLTMGPKG
jgi:hypothetical protein